MGVSRSEQRLLCHTMAIISERVLLYVSDGTVVTRGQLRDAVSFSKDPLNNNKKPPLWFYARFCRMCGERVYAAANNTSDQHGLKPSDNISLLNSHTTWCLSDVGKRRNCSALDWIQRISTSLCNLSAYENEIDRYHCLL